MIEGVVLGCSLNLYNEVAMSSLIQLLNPDWSLQGNSLSARQTTCWGTAQSQGKHSCRPLTQGDGAGFRHAPPGCRVCVRGSAVILHSAAGKSEWLPPAPAELVLNLPIICFHPGGENADCKRALSSTKKEDIKCAAYARAHSSPLRRALSLLSIKSNVSSKISFSSHLPFYFSFIFDGGLLRDK